MPIALAAGPTRCQFRLCRLATPEMRRIGVSGPTEPPTVSELRWKHGKSASVEYRVWRGMITRCENPRRAQYKNYGGRGIRVCRRWRRSFAAFLADMGARPSVKHSLDRYPDNDGAYRPGNCRWATKVQQGANMRRNRLIRFRGERLPLATWARRYRLTGSCIYWRLKNGWKVQTACTTPAQERRRSG